MSPLAARLARRITAAGPITVAEFMAAALGDSEHGYYRRRRAADAGPIGRSGDFITAPEISQIFGELIGAWLIDRWNALGCPDPVRLVELGPGRGVLMADILRVARMAPAWRSAIDLHLVEISPDLRRIQAETLADVEPCWHDSLDTVPDGPMLLVANEFFDALPIRQLVRHGGVWRERLVDWSEEGGFAFEPGIRPSPLAVLVPAGIDRAEGAVFEVCATAIGVVSALSRRLVAQGGAALILDYGGAHSAAADTLQAVKHHAKTGPLAEPGEADLSAHVDFAMLATVAREAGAVVAGPITQGEFLVAMGAALRVKALKQLATSRQAEAIDAAITRLIDPSAMGDLFKALALSAPGA